MAVVRGIEVLGMRASVHVDGAERVWSADVEDVNTFRLRHVHEFHAVRRDELARTAGRLAARVRLVALEVGLTRGVQRARPRLERHGLERDVVGQMTGRISAVDALRVERQLDDAGGCPEARFTRWRPE